MPPQQPVAPSPNDPSKPALPSSDRYSTKDHKIPASPLPRSDAPPNSPAPTIDSPAKVVDHTLPNRDPAQGKVTTSNQSGSLTTNANKQTESSPTSRVFLSKDTSYPIVPLTDHPEPVSDFDHTLLKTEEVLEESPARYLAYANRVRTALVASSRYLAFTSDLGEAFRPVSHPNFVKAAYGISWAYVLGDVALETWREKERGSDSSLVLRTGTKRALFQTTASMILPMILIHQTVHLTGNLVKRSGSSSRLVRLLPTMVGLGAIPLLPFLFDHPVDHAIDYAYDRLWPLPPHARTDPHSQGQYPQTNQHAKRE